MFLVICLPLILMLIGNGLSRLDGAILILVFLFVAIALDPPKVLFAIFAVYLISGPLGVFGRIKKS